jgi:hypothetical protein
VLSEYQLVELDTADRPPEQFTVVGQVLWAPNSSGVVVNLVRVEANNLAMIWLSINGDPSIELGSFPGDIKR